MAQFNPIKTTSRDFNSILADIDSDTDLRSKPNWWKRIWAGVGDMLNRMIDATYNLVFLRTAYTRRAVTDLVQLIDYFPRPQQASSGTQRFNINPAASFPLNLPKETLAAITQGSVAVASLRFESRVDQVFNPSSETFTADDVTDILTVGSVYDTGDLVRVSSGGTLPGGLTAGTNYYAIYVSDTEIKLASSAAQAALGTAIDLTSTGTGILTITSYALKIPVFQQTSQADFVILAQSDGVTEWQTIDIPDSNVLEESIQVRIAAQIWTPVTNFAESQPTDQHYKIFFKFDNTAAIKFGDGTFGLIPPSGDIEVKWANGGGLDSNVFTIGAVNTYAGTSSDVLDTGNVTQMTGGSDEESIDSVKNIAPELLKTRDRFVTVADGEFLSLAFGGINKARVNPNAFGVLTVQVLIVPNGGGLPSAALKDSLEDYLIDRTLLSDPSSIVPTVDVRVEDPLYVVVAPTTQFKVKSGFIFSQVLPFFELAWQLFFGEVTEEIIQARTVSIDDAVAFINSKYGSGFGSADYNQISILIDAIEAIGTRQFGETIAESDITAYVDTYVQGVDYLTISLPAFPIVLADDEITTIGTITATEIP